MRLISFFEDYQKLEKLLSSLERPINRMDTKISDLHKSNQGKSNISCYDWIPTTNYRQIRNVPQSWNGYLMRHTWVIIRELNRAGWAIPVDGFWRERNIKIGEKKAPHRFSGYLESVSRLTLTIFSVRSIFAYTATIYSWCRKNQAHVRTPSNLSQHKITDLHAIADPWSSTLSSE